MGEQGVYHNSKILTSNTRFTGFGCPFRGLTKRVRGALVGETHFLEFLAINLQNRVLEIADIGS